MKDEVRGGLKGGGMKWNGMVGKDDMRVEEWKGMKWGW